MKFKLPWISLPLILCLSICLVGIGEAAQAPPETASPPKTAPALKAVAPAKARVAPTVTQRPTSAPAVPTDASSAAVTAQAAIAAARGGKWWYFSALVLMVLMFLVKFVGLKMGWWARLGRWRYIIVPLLSLAAALLAAFQGGITMEAAIAVFTSSYATSSLQELYEHGILGQPRKSAGG